LSFEFVHAQKYVWVDGTVDFDGTNGVLTIRAKREPLRPLA
jgi:hypothetical protein